MKLAISTAKSIVDEAKHISDPDLKRELIKWSSTSLSQSKMNKMLALAETDMAIKPEEFDTNKWLLNVRNGTIDLKTDTLMQHDKSNFITKMCDAAYDPDAESLLWGMFLEKIFDGNADMIKFVQKMIGYCLTGDIREKCFFILLGEKGDNGKTVLINVLMKLFNEFGLQTPIDTLLNRRPGSQSNDIVRLKGARFVSSAEASKKCYFDEALVKRLTGNDPITARALYKEHITFYPECKIMIATNRVPRFDKDDTAFNNRVKLVNFNVSIPEAEQDKNLSCKLYAELDGILNWAVKGCMLWQVEGLGDVPVVDESMVEIKCNSSIDNFIETCCVLSDSAKTITRDMYDAYLVYHTEIDDGSEPLSYVAFSQQLDFASGHTNKGNYRLGVALKTNETPTPVSIPPVETNLPDSITDTM
jgi:putative DNA primase/helicase